MFPWLDWPTEKDRWFYSICLFRCLYGGFWIRLRHFCGYLPTKKTILKYYFSDIGLRNARLNFRQQEPAHIMENIVYNEQLIRGYNVDVGIVEVYAKNNEGKTTRKQLEVDFVVNQGSQRYYIQAAYDMASEEKRTQEFNSFRKIPDSFKKIVIVNGTKKNRGEMKKDL